MCVYVCVCVSVYALFEACSTNLNRALEHVRRGIKAKSAVSSIRHTSAWQRQSSLCTVYRVHTSNAVKFESTPIVYAVQEIKFSTCLMAVFYIIIYKNWRTNRYDSVFMFQHRYRHVRWRHFFALQFSDDYGKITSELGHLVWWHILSLYKTQSKRGLDHLLAALN